MIEKGIVWENFATGVSGDIMVEHAFLREIGKMYDLFCQKQRDYGRGNIAKFGELGVLVRTSDKIERLRNLLHSLRDPANESLADTWRDISIYGVIGGMCHKGDWPAPEQIYSE